MCEDRFTMVPCAQTHCLHPHPPLTQQEAMPRGEGLSPSPVCVSLVTYLGTHPLLLLHVFGK